MAYHRSVTMGARSRIKIPKMLFFEKHTSNVEFSRSSVEIDITDYTTLAIDSIATANTGATQATVKIIGIKEDSQTELYSTHANANNLNFDIVAYDKLLITCIGSTLYMKTITNLICE